VPAEQRGSIFRTRTGYGIRWYGPGKTRRQKSGFATKREARRWWEAEVRPGLTGVEPEREPVTLSAFVAQYLDRHAVGREPVTIKALRERLNYATKAFPWTLDELETRPDEIAEWIRALPE
jgi:hypothetical protein